MGSLMAPLESGETAMRGVRIVALICLVFLAFDSSAFAREWKDSTGQISRAGDFVDYRDGRVVVRRADGRETSTALEQFSAADQAYVRRLAEGKAERAPVPAKLAARTVDARTANYETASPPANSITQDLPPGRTEAPAGASEEQE